MGCCSSSVSLDFAGSFLPYEKIITKLRPGDLIEVKRPGYAHWVMCGPIEKHDDIVSGTIVWCYHIVRDKEQRSLARIKKETLWDILKDTVSPEPSLCRVNNQKNTAKKVLKKYNKKQPSISEVLEFLENSLDMIVKYDIVTANCEHYSTVWKYGIGWSSQFDSYKHILCVFAKRFVKVTMMINPVAFGSYYKWCDKIDHREFYVKIVEGEIKFFARENSLFKKKKK